VVGVGETRSEVTLEERVATMRVARLATTRPDGRPHVVPICFVLDGDVLYTAVDWKPKRSRRLARLENVRADPRAAVLIDHYDDDWSHLWWVRLDGRARILAGGSERERALTLLAARYPQYSRKPPAGPVIAIDVEARRGWAFDNPEIVSKGAA
jgi:PPOX class probable F420-dependent enzyme